MKPYIALTLLYNKDLLEQPDPETGTIRLVEAGFVYPGQLIELEDERAEPLLFVGAIEPAPPITLPLFESPDSASGFAATPDETPE